MWIIPSNHPLYSHYAQACVGSKEELKELSGQFEQQLFWKSKPLSLKIWSGKWSRVYWLPHLFGRMLKPSHQNSFTERYTASLEDIHVSHLVLRESNSEKKTHATYGHTSKQWLEQLDLFGVSSKMCLVTSISDTSKLDLIWSSLVTKLKKEYSQRKKLARHIREKDYSSLQWGTPTSTNRERNEETMKKCLEFRKKNGQTSVPLYLGEQVKKSRTTPIASDQNRNTKYQQGGTALSLQVKQNWGTPRVTTNNGMGQAHVTNKARIEDQVLNWGTPTTRDWKDGTAESVKNVPENGLLGRQVHRNPNLNGSRLVLNPAWVSLLMGIHLEKIFFAYSEMVWWNRQQKLLLDPYYINSINEFWVDVKGYEGLYQVSIFGRLKSVKRTAKRRNGTTREVPEIILSPICNDKGYIVLTLSKNGLKKRFRRCRVVAESFCVNPNNYKEVNHVDGNKENDYADNLEWCTRSQNMKHAYNIGLRK